MGYGWASCSESKWVERFSRKADDFEVGSEKRGDLLSLLQELYPILELRGTWKWHGWLMDQ